MKKDVLSLAVKCVPEHEELFHVIDVANYIDVSEHRIRYWHQLGLFDTNTRSDKGRYRKFSKKDMERAQKIKNLRTKGLSLKIIKYIINHEDSNDIELEKEEKAN